MLTEEIIDKLVLLFDEDQKNALEFTQGNRQMTLKRQIKHYFGDLFTFTNDEDKFLDGFALNIQRNLATIYKIGNWKNNSKKLAEDKNFTRVSFAVTDSTSNNDKRTFSINTGTKEYLKHGRSSSGSTERSDDWQGVEELYTLRNQEILKSDLNIDIKKIGQFPEAPTDSQKKEDLNIPLNPIEIKQELVEPSSTIEEQKKDLREMPTWNTFGSASDSAKARNTDLSNRDSIEKNKGYSDGTNLGVNFSTAENINKSIEADLHDLRTLFWNSFRHLFQDCYPCR